MAVALSLPVALGGCVGGDPETVGGIVSCTGEPLVTRLNGRGPVLAMMVPERCADGSRSQDPNWYAFDCGRGQQMTVFNAVHGPVEAASLVPAAEAARRALAGGATLEATARRLKAAGLDADLWPELVPSPAAACAAAN